MEYNTLARTSPDEAYDVIHAWVGSLRAFSNWRGCAAMRRGPEFVGVKLILGTDKVRATHDRSGRRQVGGSDRAQRRGPDPHAGALPGHHRRRQ
jgi:hypothetical protein